MTGGTGTDQFYVDDRNPSGDIWSTLQNFHSGDSATIWGLNPNDFTIDLLNGQGAIGAQGLTFSATADGQPNANLTIAGYSMSDVNSGKLDVSFGHSPDTGSVSGSDYMMIKAV